MGKTGPSPKGYGKVTNRLQPIADFGPLRRGYVIDALTSYLRVVDAQGEAFCESFSRTLAPLATPTH
jgi:hypothetical protein